ncbi:MAG: hypothetical protein ACRDWY_00795 [Actinomycetes bacterium]
MITPAGFERFFMELADLADAGPPDLDELERLAASYGLFFDTTWVSELTAKCQLTPPSAN